MPIDYLHLIFRGSLINIILTRTAPLYIFTQQGTILVSTAIAVLQLHAECAVNS
jgi:hypothetical protein